VKETQPKLQRLIFAVTLIVLAAVIALTYWYQRSHRRSAGQILKDNLKLIDVREQPNPSPSPTPTIRYNRSSIEPDFKDLEQYFKKTPTPKPPGQ
jgi:hypothetical protein